MKYSIPYTKNFKYYDKIDEVVITCLENTDLDQILAEMEAAGASKDNITIILKFYQPELLLQINYTKLLLANYNVKVGFPTFTHLKYVDDKIFDNLTKLISGFKEKNIPYFYINPCSSWEQLYEYCNDDVSDIYISGELGFNLAKINILVHNSNKNIRIIPNYAYSDYKIPDLKKFFIRPEDLIYFEDYIDLIELYPVGNSINTLFKIYFIDEEWADDLKIIIENLDNYCDNTFLVREFGITRVNCGRKCMSLGRSCRCCEKMELLARQTRRKIKNEKIKNNVIILL